MRRILAVLLLLIAAASVFPQATVVVFDLSYSMSLPVEDGTTRKDFLINGLADFLAESGSPPCALVLFDDRDSIELAVPYPASTEWILEEIRGRTPWGTSPILSAVRFAVEVAGQLVSARIVVVTDGEDDAAFISARPESVPEAIATGRVPLSVIVMSRDSPGAAPTLWSWAEISGGAVIELAPDARLTAVVGHALAEHETQASGAPAAGAPAAGAPAAGAPAAQSSRPSHATAKVLAAWLVVTRWNLVAAFAAAIVASIRSYRRGLRRRRRADEYNRALISLTLDIRTTLTRFSQTFTRFPVEVGTRSGASVTLDPMPDGSAMGFSLSPEGDGLRFESDTKLKINGMVRTSWLLQNGDLVRLGKYRILVEEYTRRKPLKMPRALTWPAPALSGVSLIAAAFIFLLFSPLAEAASLKPAQSVSISELNEIGEGGQAPGFVPPAADQSPADSSSGDPRDEQLPSVSTRLNGIDYFDADYLLVHAHPDDESLDNGILLARLSAAGLQGVVVLLTDGQSGIDQYPDRDVDDSYPAHDLVGADLVAVRVREATRALSHLGVRAFVRGQLPNYPYNSVSDQLSPYQVLGRWGGASAVARELATVIEGFQPELVISPDGPAGPYEHFEHEATGLATKMALDLVARDGRPVRAHIMGVDPLQTGSYNNLIALSPWDVNPETGRPYRWQQLLALEEHRTQRDASSVGIETRLAVQAEYYAIDVWDPDYLLPVESGLGYDVLHLSQAAPDVP